MFDSVLVWFRRDLRSIDHAALAEATRRARHVYCVFVFDNEILGTLPSRSDRRVEFIRESLVELERDLRDRGGGLIVRNGLPFEEIPKLAMELGVTAVFANRDYEPQAKRRDARVAQELAEAGIGFETFKDQVVFEYPQVLTLAGKSFSVFTPFKNAWLKRLTEDDLEPFVMENERLANAAGSADIPELKKIGFEPTDMRQLGIVPGMRGAMRLLENFRSRIERYQELRDYPAVEGVSCLSVHLRFGTISIRQLVSFAIESGALRGNEGPATWLAELIWREFYFMILDCFPHVVERSFKPEFDRIRWEEGAHAEKLFDAWCSGQTGYPLVDAAMRQLNDTGYMHNRLRMLTASFLVKDLGIDWRRGEAYFARRLVDFDLSANNGGWQWASSSGCDAQPYFRIFNPVAQSERYDPQGQFIRRYLPELAALPDRYIHAPWRMSAREQADCGFVVGEDTPAPLVEHEQARRRTLERYAVVRKADGVAPYIRQPDAEALPPDTVSRDSD